MILKRFVPSETTISFQSFVRQRQFDLNGYYLYDQASGFEDSDPKNEGY